MADPAINCGAADLAPYQHFVFVSAEGTDSANCGATAATACKTIQQGINRCTETGCAVLVRQGLYPTSATIKLRNAVSVLGSCRFNNEADQKYRTTIQASPASGYPALVADGVNSATMVYGLVVVGMDEAASGTASIAMAVSDSTGLTLSRLVLAAGKGGDGAGGGEVNGARGGDGSAPTCPTCRGAAGIACRRWVWATAVRARRKTRSTATGARGAVTATASAAVIDSASPGRAACSPRAAAARGQAPSAAAVGRGCPSQSV